MPGDKHFGEYILVISSNDEIDVHINDVIKLNQFKDRPEDMRARIIWISEKWVKIKENIHLEWPEMLVKRGRLPRKWFVEDPDEPLSNPITARMELDILNTENLIPLKKIGKQIVSAIIFSDNEESDARLTLLIGLLKNFFPHINIAAECTQSEVVPYLWEAGADEVFNRKLMLNRTMALNLISDTKISFFLSNLMPKSVEKLGIKSSNSEELGLKSSFLGSVRLLLPGNSLFSLDKSNWKRLHTIASEEQVNLIAIFQRKGSKFALTPFIPGYNIKLKGGDCLLVLTPSYENLNKFEARIIDDETFLEESLEDA